MNECPLTCFDGGISELHLAQDAAFNWVQTYGFCQYNDEEEGYYTRNTRQLIGSYNIYSPLLVTPKQISVIYLSDNPALNCNICGNNKTSNF